MKTITLLFFALLFASKSSAQDWQNYLEDQGVKIQYRTIEYINASSGQKHERVVFRYENTSKKEIHLNFKRLITYTGSETKTQEKMFELIIPANSSIEYETTNSTDKTFYIFAKDLNKTIKNELIKFDIQIISIK